MGRCFAERVGGTARWEVGRNGWQVAVCTIGNIDKMVTSSTHMTAAKSPRTVSTTASCRTRPDRRLRIIRIWFSIARSYVALLDRNLIETTGGVPFSSRRDAG